MAKPKPKPETKPKREKFFLVIEEDCDNILDRFSDIDDAKDETKEYDEDTLIKEVEVVAEYRKVGWIEKKK